jgi:hypothetical protein
MAPGGGKATASQIARGAALRTARGTGFVRTDLENGHTERIQCRFSVLRPSINGRQRLPQFTLKRNQFAGRDAAPQQAAVAAQPASRTTDWPVALFLFSLFVPWTIPIGPLRLSVYRIFLLAMVVPCLARWRAGKAGRIRRADITLFVFWVWCALALVVNHGMAASLQPNGIGFVETVGAYLLARCYIRNADDFHYMVQSLFRIGLLLLPFAFVEFVTGKNIWRDMFAAIWEVNVYAQMPPRSGLYRVQMGLDHPILFGVCIGSIVAPVYLVMGYQKSFFQRSWKAAIIALLSAMSLSAGPLIAVFLQGALLMWNGMLNAVKSRWQLLIGLLVSMGIVAELAANRSLVNIFVSLFVFDSGSYWYRLAIWQYGTNSVARHPLFGIGLNDWERPAWMYSSSMDNFWLLWSVKYGLPAVSLLLLTMLSIVLALSFKKGLDDRTSAYRAAYLMSILALFLAGGTAHYWDAAYVFFLFFLGSGMWMLDVEQRASDPSVVSGSVASPLRRVPGIASTRNASGSPGIRPFGR